MTHPIDDWNPFEGIVSEKPSDKFMTDRLQETPIRFVIELSTTPEHILAMLRSPEVQKTLSKICSGTRRGPKLSLKIASEIRRRASEGETNAVLAKEFDVTVDAIRDILSGKTYKSN